jgi:hypothetical protein
MTFRSDPARTRRRIDRLGEYFDREVLARDSVVCSSLAGCRRSALFGRDERRRDGVEFAAGQLPHVGHHYDLVENGVPLRVLIIAMEMGRPDDRVSLERRRLQLAQSAALTMTARNPHMQGVTSALRLAVGRAPGPDRDGELLDLDDDEPVHLFDAYAMTNIRLCSAFASGSTDSRGTAVMSRNCLRHLSETLRILEPTLCIVQGVDVAAGITRIVDSEVRLGPQLVQAVFGGVDTMIASFAHPSARRPLRWGGLTGVPYLEEVVTPEIRQAREVLTASPPGRDAAPAAPSPLPQRSRAGVRQRVSLPMRATTTTGPRPTPTPRRSTVQVAADARSTVAAEIGRRGGVTIEQRVGMRIELKIKSQDGVSRAVRVVSRRSGDWQTSIDVGYSEQGAPDRYWIFVDLAQRPARYYIAPEDWVIGDIRAEHDAYLARNGGRRARTEDSKHHRVQTARVARWADRWDLLGLE